MNLQLITINITHKYSCANLHELCILIHSLFAGPNNFVYKNISFSDSNLVACSFLSNQSFYCMVCCSTDPSAPPDSSVYNISTTRDTEVTVSLQGLTSGQMYYCKAAATNTNSTHCAGPVVGNSKMYFSIATRLPSITPSTTCKYLTPECSMTVYKQCIEVEELEMYFSRLKPLKKHTQIFFQMHVFYRHAKGLKGSSDSDIDICLREH